MQPDLAVIDFSIGMEGNGPSSSPGGARRHARPAGLVAGAREHRPRRCGRHRGAHHGPGGPYVEHILRWRTRRAWAPSARSRSSSSVRGSTNYASNGVRPRRDLRPWRSRSRAGSGQRGRSRRRELREQPAPSDVAKGPLDEPGDQRPVGLRGQSRTTPTSRSLPRTAAGRSASGRTG